MCRGEFLDGALCIARLLALLLVASPSYNKWNYNFKKKEEEMVFCTCMGFSKSQTLSTGNKAEIVMYNLE